MKCSCSCNKNINAVIKTVAEIAKQHGDCTDRGCFYGSEKTCGEHIAELILKSRPAQMGRPKD